VRFLPVNDVRERAVLPLDEHTCVQHYRDEKTRLAFGEPERFNRVNAIRGDLFDIPTVGWLGKVHRNSSIPFGFRVPPRPEPPLDARK
jgi:hypothetical protein